MNNPAEKTQSETLDNYCANLIENGLEYSCKFVPFSTSRNRYEKQPSLNWIVTIRKGHAELVTDYMQGIGHIPGFNINSRMTIHVNNLVRRSCELGVKYESYRRLDSPSLSEVLYCLVLDAYVLECASFEDWASEFGYDEDSQSAESIYNECMKNALRLKSIIDLNEARKATEDY